MMAQAYDFLADWFEFLNDDCDYAAWSQYFIDGLKARSAGTNGLEVGCGSGYFCRALARAGYHMTGADISDAMLSKATALAAKEGVSVQFLHADAAKLRVPSRYDFIIAPNDCYNYIPQNALPAAFKRAAESLKKGALFWFDISSAYKLREKIANNIFADDRDEVTYLSFNALKEDRVETDVTLFVRGEDGKFSRFDEKHVQYIHEEKDVLAALASAGFETERVEGHLGGDKRGSDRLNFLCRRI